MIERQVDHLVRLVDDLLEVARITQRQDRAAPRARRAGRGRARGASRRAGPRSSARGTPARRCRSPAEPLVARRRRRAARAGRREPAEQRGEVHRGPAARSGSRAQREGDWVDALGARHRHRHSAGDAAARLRPVHAGRPHARPRAGRARHRAGAGEAPGRDARRQRRGAQRGPRRGSEFIVRLPARARARRAPADAAPAPSSSRCRERAAARCWSSTTTATRPTASRCCCGMQGAEVARRVRRRHRRSRRRARRAPDIVLLDLGMPGMDGFEVARAAARRAARSQARVLVALTGWGQPEHRRATRRGGLRSPPGEAGRPGRSAGPAHAPALSRHRSCTDMGTP